MNLDWKSVKKCNNTEVDINNQSLQNVRNSRTSNNNNNCCNESDIESCLLKKELKSLFDNKNSGSNSSPRYSNNSNSNDNETNELINHSGCNDSSNQNEQKNYFINGSSNGCLEGIRNYAINSAGNYEVNNDIDKQNQLTNNSGYGLMLTSNMSDFMKECRKKRLSSEECKIMNRN